MLNNTLDGILGYEEFIPTLKGRRSQKQKDEADKKVEKQMKSLATIFWEHEKRMFKNFVL